MKHPDQLREEIARLQNRITEARSNRALVRSKYDHSRLRNNWGANSFEALDAHTSFNVNISTMETKLEQLDYELAVSLQAK